MYSIGEFSTIVGLSVKTLRHYHQQGVLVPDYVDPQTGYRYYKADNLERARAVVCLRKLEFPLGEIKEILDACDDESDVLDYLQRQQAALAAKMLRYRGIVVSLKTIISSEREAKRIMQDSPFQVEEKTLPATLIAGIRMKGAYRECGQGFARLGKGFGRHICGKPFCLHYDDEYREDDADFEACVPIRKPRQLEGVDVRELPGGRGVTLLHQGPYEQLGRSYAKILQYVKQQGYQIVRPTREVYLKGPGMIFRGKAKKYLTEIQMLIED